MKENSNNKNKDKNNGGKNTQKDDNNTIIVKVTQESLFESKAFECTLIDDDNDKYDNNIVLIPTQVIFRMCDRKLNLKWKSKRQQKWQKEKYSRKVKMKIAIMITNTAIEYPMNK